METPKQWNLELSIYLNETLQKVVPLVLTDYDESATSSVVPADAKPIRLTLKLQGAEAGLDLAQRSSRVREARYYFESHADNFVPTTTFVYDAAGQHPSILADPQVRITTTYTYAVMPKPDPESAKDLPAKEPPPDEPHTIGSGSEPRPSTS
jgi:hypothetical protein